MHLSPNMIRSFQCPLLGTTADPGCYNRTLLAKGGRPTALGIWWFPKTLGLNQLNPLDHVLCLKYNTAHLVCVGPNKGLTCINLHNIMRRSCPPVFLSHFAWSAQINKTPPLSTQSYSCHPTIELRHTKTCPLSLDLSHTEILSYSENIS